MTRHKHWSRSQLVLEQANKVTNRKLGKVQASVLKALLERGTYPGNWYWQNLSTTTKALEGLVRRGLVTTELVDKTDLQGNPDPRGGKVTFYRPVQWMRDAMSAPEEQVYELLGIH